MPSYTIGRSGLIPAEDKREGDGCTPLGIYSLREIWYRADRMARPSSSLPIREITPDDCWCDDPEHELYNQYFRLSDCRKLSSKTPSSFERLWRDDHAYDVIVVIGYNDDPPIHYKGSAIFIHCNHDDGRPTAGCVAMAKDDLLQLISTLNKGSRIRIERERISIE